MAYLLRRVKKFGPVFKSNIYGQDVVVVADFTGVQKVRYPQDAHRLGACVK